MVSKIARILSFSLIAALLLLAVPAVTTAKGDCGDFEEIASGDSLDATITKKNYAQAYCFIGSEGDEITVEMTATSGNLDPYLLITDVTIENTFADNDNISKKNKDSQIVYTLEADGAYLIVATHTGVKKGTTTGDYTVTYSSSGNSTDVNSDLSTLTLFDDTITVSYPSSLVFLGGKTDASATLASDKAALKAKPSALKKGQYQITLDVFSYDSVQTIADVFVKNKKFADFVKKYGKKAAPAYLALLEVSLLTDTTLKDFGQVNLGNLDVVKTTLERDVAVGTIAYAFKTDSGDFMLIAGHVNGNSKTFTQFETFLDAMVDGIAFN